MEEAVPLVDLKKISEQVECNKLREACEKWGCFRIINHSIPITLMAEMKKVVGALFDLPMEIKKRNTDVIVGSGYITPKAPNPFYESFGLHDLGSSQAMQDFCSQLNVTPHQRQIIEAYGQAIHDLAVVIAQKMAESLGILGVDFEDWPCEYRLNKYHFSQQVMGSPGLQLHTDASFLTILQDDENVGGLEVMDNFGSLVAVPPLPGTLLANLGDIAHVWSNGTFCNVKHRVELKEATTRMSIATFMLAPSRNGNIEAPAGVVDHDHPQLYDPFTYEDYRKHRYSNNMYAGEGLRYFACSSQYCQNYTGETVNRTPVRSWFIG